MGRYLRAAVALLVGTTLLAPAAEARSYSIVRTGIYALRTDLLVAVLAKEMCSCRHVSRTGEGRPIEDAVAICLERSQLPVTPGLIRRLAGIEVRDDEQEFEVTRNFLGRIAGLFQGSSALVRYDPSQPRYGCRFVQARRQARREVSPR